MQNSTQAAANWRHRVTYIAAVAAVLTITILCYRPSLSGPFIFDDTPNLELLAVQGGVKSFEAFVEFVSSAQAGPFGRPLSLASFVIDGQTWPTDPLPFRITNLILHLLNGVLVLLLSQALLVTQTGKAVAWRAAIACMALWLLHPLLVSTTAYVIQRMTQLASLFILTGLLSYIRGRKLLDTQPGRGWTWILLGMGLSGLLAVLSKESGILLPLYALTIELTVFSRTHIARAKKTALLAVLIAPSLAVPAYFALNWETLQAGFEFRPFSMGERLLTQAVVLMQYLKQVVAPSMSGLGIIHDDFPVSQSLMNPISTLLSVLGIAAATVLALWLRGRSPIVSLGILWFLVGHSLEAGPLPLELYFEHRNYLPLVGPLLAVCAIVSRTPDTIRRYAYVGIVLFLCLEGFVTWQNSKLWSDEDLMMHIAVTHHPNSLRARQHVGNQEILSGRFDLALATQTSIAADFPEHTSTRLSMLNLHCLLGSLTRDHIDTARVFLERGTYDQQIPTFFPVLLARVENNACPVFGSVEFRGLLDAALGNSRIGGNKKLRGAALYFKAISLYGDNLLDEAVGQLDQSFDAWPEIDVRLQQVVWLLSAGRPEDARRYLDLARQFREEQFWRKNLRDKNIDALQHMIDERSR